MVSFQNKVVAITGAGSGIGRALAIKLASEGARLGLSDINGYGLAETHDMVRDVGGHAESSEVDVASMDQVQSWVDGVETDLGCIDMIINNAGVSLIDIVHEQSLDDMQWIMNINFWGVVHGVKAVLPKMRECGGGQIVNVSSLFGLLSVPSQSAYNASKFAVRGFTEALALEEMHNGIIVSCVHPGGIKTDIAKNARFRRDNRGGGSHEKFIDYFDKLAKTSSEKAAEIILKGVRAGKRRILVGSDAWLLDKIQRLFPENYNAIIKKIS